MAIKKEMKVVLILLLLIAPASASAADFDWMGGLNTDAKADPAEFSSSLAERFRMDTSTVKSLLDAVSAPADAYMVMRMAEMSGRPTDLVLKRYGAKEKKGWGALAKSLGIKPGSQEFHALKQGHDLYRAQGKNKSKDTHGYKIPDTGRDKDTGPGSSAGGGTGKNQPSGQGRGKK